MTEQVNVSWLTATEATFHIKSAIISQHHFARLHSPASNAYCFTENENRWQLALRSFLALITRRAARTHNVPLNKFQRTQAIRGGVIAI